MSDKSSRISSDDARSAYQEYSRTLTTQLSVTARKLRLATSNRSNLFKAVGLRPRLGDRLFAAALVVTTIVIFVVPNALAIAYFGMIATDQYQSEARFILRSSTPALGRDQMAKVTGLPAAKIAQDTQIVTNYIGSNELLNELAKFSDITKFYSGENIDFWSRLDVDETAEEKLSYWKSMTTTSINPSSGIVTLKVRAFSAVDARDILGHVVALSEKMVNAVNDRIWKDVLETAGANLESAGARLQDAREDLLNARNKYGVLSVQGSSTMLDVLIGNLQKEMLGLQQRYNSQPQNVSKSAPQMLLLQREIASKQKQIDELKAKIAGDAARDENLVNISAKLSQLELEQGLAEQGFSAAVRTLEQVKFVSQQQLVYLDTFLSPTLPDESGYPKRIFWIGIIFVASLIAWGTALGLLHVGRSRLN
ncbi:capsule biosynthesis protein [Ensifer sp. ENS10]|uniref:capsule biosynthesis protein n=1 Tax=Ensifer sp. ENS10 TaxID=2769286 RepID=UPI00178286EC|nr:capsule biosynthesis protein [Ensifer sp. ENS10]MBD9510552.1 capsule biosynthesis protein [Ensifer sp. ENS10]